ncbi:MAG: hypothetical protein JRJ62_15360 [Deltaproteobacteria bacterium]|nr:hypothetical protein [Deltaproteobacteria bacterium]
MPEDEKKALEICLNCSRSCCEFLAKPRYTKIAKNCDFFLDRKCSKHVSADFKERIKAGRPIVCELFPAVVDIPVSEGKFIKVKIMMHSFCKHADEILALPSERRKIEKVIQHVFDKAAKNEYVGIMWGQFQIIRQEILKNPNYELKIIYTTESVS